MADVQPTFTCFDDAGEFCMRNGGTVVHGLIPRPHAWVELDGKVWQGGVIEGKRSFFALVLDEFYALYKPLKTSRYTPKLLLSLWKQHNYPGPWRAEYRAQCTDAQTILGEVRTAAVVEIRVYETGLGDTLA